MREYLCLYLLLYLFLNHLFYLFFFSDRTTSNIIFDDISSENGAVSLTVSEDEDKSNDSKENKPLQKRRRSSSASSSDQMRIYESFAKTMRENHNEKMNMIQQLQDSKSQTELECYFASICKTVEKFPPIEQAKVKLQISQIVSQIEIAQLESNQQYYSRGQNTLVYRTENGTTYEISDAEVASNLLNDFSHEI